MRGPYAVVLVATPEHRPTALGIIRALGAAGIPVAVVASRHLTPSFTSRYVRRRLLCPSMEEKPEQWKDALVRFASSCDEKPVLFPSSDEHVLAVHHYRDALSRSFRYSFLPRDVLVACLDKRRMYEICRSVGIETGRAIPIPASARAEDVARDAVFPSVLKPAMWADVDAATPRRDRAFLEEFKQKALTVESWEALVDLLARARRRSLSVLLQEKVAGPASAIVHVSVYADQQSNVRGLFVGRKTRQFPSEFGNACMIETAPCPEAAALVTSLVKAMGFRGIAGGIELKRHPQTGRLHFLELNPRPGAMVSATTAAGVNLPELAYRDAIGAALPALTIGERSIRWIEGRSDLRYWLEYRKGDHTGQPLSLREYIRSLRGRRDYAYWAPGDPLPWLARVGRAPAELFRALGR